MLRQSAIGLAFVGLVARYTYFAWLHLISFLNGSWSNLLFLSVETTILLLFLVRRRAATISSRPIDVALAFGGTFAGVLFRPVDAPGESGTPILVIGLGLQLVALFSLNRGFGILPAVREIKTGGLYAFVRHPLYAAYLVAWVGYVTNNPSVWNGGILVSVTVLLALRALAEERWLLREEAYRAYAARVRWRLVPSVF